MLRQNQSLDASDCCHNIKELLFSSRLKGPLTYTLLGSPGKETFAQSDEKVMLLYLASLSDVFVKLTQCSE